MRFNEIKKGYTLYILDTQNMTVQQSKVTAVSLPHIDSRIGSAPAQMVIDITVEFEEKTATYCMKDSLDISYAGSLAITPNNDMLLHEIESAKTQSEQVIASVDHHRELVEKADKLLMEYNPSFKERRENEERFTKLEDVVNGLSDKLSLLLDKLKQN